MSFAISPICRLLPGVGKVFTPRQFSLPFQRPLFLTTKTPAQPGRNREDRTTAVDRIRCGVAHTAIYNPTVAATHFAAARVLQLSSGQNNCRAQKYHEALILNRPREDLSIKELKYAIRVFELARAENYATQRDAYTDASLRLMQHGYEAVLLEKLHRLSSPS